MHSAGNETYGNMATSLKACPRRRYGRSGPTKVQTRWSRWFFLLKGSRGCKAREQRERARFTFTEYTQRSWCTWCYILSVTVKRDLSDRCDPFCRLCRECIWLLLQSWRLCCNRPSAIFMPLPLKLPCWHAQLGACQTILRSAERMFARAMQPWTWTDVNLMRFLCQRCTARYPSCFLWCHFQSGRQLSASSGISVRLWLMTLFLIKLRDIRKHIHSGSVPFQSVDKYAFLSSPLWNKSAICTPLGWLLCSARLCRKILRQEGRAHRHTCLVYAF